MSIQLRLGAAAAARQVQMLAGETSRGVGHDDPRPLDWAQADRQQYQFLADQLAAGDKTRRGVDFSKLKNQQLTELWAFARFEADRAERNIDHLTAGLSHLKAQTANYLTERHRLEARFYGYLAGELEPHITPEMQDEYWHS